MTIHFWKRLLSFAFAPLHFNSPSPPAPDPRIGAAAEQNQELGRESLAFSKQVYEEGKPRQAELDALTGQVVRGALDTQQKSSAAADDYLNYMRTVFRPLEEGLAKDAAEFDTDARREELAARAGADVEQATAAGDAAARRDAARFGVNPADGAFADHLAGSAVNKTAAKVGVMNAARTAARTEGRALKFDVAGLGRGLPAAGATSAQLGLQAGSQALGAAGAPASNARADAALAQAGYGTAIGANNSAANIYSGLYNAQMNAFNASQAADASMWGGVGSLAGQLGTAAILKGGFGGLSILSSKKLKHRGGKVPASVAARGVRSIPIERWRYKKAASPDQAEHIGPMAEDFKKTFGVGDGKTIHVADAIGVNLAATQAVAKQVDKLERRVASIARFGVKAGKATATAARKGVR